MDLPIPGVDQLLGLFGLDRAARKDRAMHRRALLRFIGECLEYGNEALREVSALRAFKWHNAGMALVPPPRPQPPESSKDHLDGFRRVEDACEAVRATWGRWTAWAVHKATPEERADEERGREAVGEIFEARERLIAEAMWCAEKAPWGQRVKRKLIADEFARVGEPDMENTKLAARPVPPIHFRPGGL